MRVAAYNTAIKQGKQPPLRTPSPLLAVTRKKKVKDSRGTAKKASDKHGVQYSTIVPFALVEATLLLPKTVSACTNQRFTFTQKPKPVATASYKAAGPVHQEPAMPCS